MGGFLAQIIMKVTEKGVCVKGFSAAGVRYGKYGLAIVLSERRCTTSLMITSNKIKAAPLLVSAEHAEKEVYGVVANSGNANAFTGERGMVDAGVMCSAVASRLNMSSDNFLVASTGVIGRQLDMDVVEGLIERASQRLSSESSASAEAARAIMTTDTFEKVISVETVLNDGTVVEIGGIAKGSGMIAPDLNHATMLCFITTSAYIPEDKIDAILSEAVEDSFNLLVVDGDTSTNDVVVLFANGMAGNRDVDENFTDALNFVAKELAKMIAKDGEGATKYIEATVKNAVSLEDARKAARAIVGSNLVKTAVFGGDPNWGRIVSAVGYSGCNLEQNKISLFVSESGREVCLVRKGKPLALDGTEELEEAEKVFAGSEIYITLDLGLGKAEATAFGCDLTYDYVKINSEYTT